jgi:hypothetical protein
MHAQPEFYSLEFFSDAHFWTVGDASTRRTFLMPLATPREFLAFGVLSPSNELIFVARGRVMDHLGPFLTRMKQAEATVELYARPPLPGHIIREYTKGDGHEQKETDAPPPAPDAQGKVILSGSAPTPQRLTAQMNLWASVSGSTRRVLKLPIPEVKEEWLAFGLVEVDSVECLEQVAFVARLKTSELGATLGGVAVSDQDVPTTLRRYVEESFPSASNLASASKSSGTPMSSVLIR